MTINKGTTSENLYSAIDLLISQKINNTRCITFAVVTKVNSESTETDNVFYTTINAQPIAAERINTRDNGKQYQILPEIYNIPYFLGNTPRVGDYCVLLHLDRSIAGTKIEAQTIKTYDGSELTVPIVYNKSKTHDLGDCVAICGFSNIYNERRLQTSNTKKQQTTEDQVTYYNSNNRVKDLETKISNLEERLQKLEDYIATNT